MSAIPSWSEALGTSGARITAAMFASATLPESGGEPFPTYALMLAMGGLLLLGGLGLVVWYYRLA